MAEPTFNVLFLCTGNSARSILAESILRKEGKGRFRAFSAGSHPKAAVNPFALKVLESYKYPTNDLRSKSWDEFAAPGAPRWISSLQSAIPRPRRRVPFGRVSR